MSEPAKPNSAGTPGDAQAVTGHVAYRAALDWIYSFSNMEHTGQFTRDREDNLARERALLDALGNPQDGYSVSHIAGSKGKGSTAALLAAILRAAGIHAGLYTSPDLHTFRERIRIDGGVVSEREVAETVPMVRAALARTGMVPETYITWEIATALAFLIFRQERVAHAVVEVGLGGRLDATNIVAPLVTAITSISYEHMEVLGHTLTAIAGEKAGIIKPGVPLVTSAQAPEALAVISRVADERSAPLTRVGPAGSPDCQYTFAVGQVASSHQTFTVTTPHGTYNDLRLGLLGEHQLENATAALALAEVLRERGLPISEEAIRDGLAQARWEGRMQLVAREPWLVVDGAHNADSMARLFAGLRRHFTFDRLVLVFGLLAGKDIDGIVAEIARASIDAIVVTAADSPRALPPTQIASLLAERLPELPVTPVVGSGAALELALDHAGERDLVCVAGSLYLVGEALRWLARRPGVIPGSIEIAGVDHA